MLIDHDFISTFMHVIGTYSFDWFGSLYIVHFYMYHMYVLQYIRLISNVALSKCITSFTYSGSHNLFHVQMR